VSHSIGILRDPVLFFAFRTCHLRCWGTFSWVHIPNRTRSVLSKLSKIFKFAGFGKHSKKSGIFCAISVVLHLGGSLAHSRHNHSVDLVFKFHYLVSQFADLIVFADHLHVLNICLFFLIIHSDVGNCSFLRFITDLLLCLCNFVFSESNFSLQNVKSTLNLVLHLNLCLRKHYLQLLIAHLRV